MSVFTTLAAESHTLSLCLFLFCKYKLNHFDPAVHKAIAISLCMTLNIANIVIKKWSPFCDFLKLKIMFVIMRKQPSRNVEFYWYCAFVFITSYWNKQTNNSPIVILS